MDDLTLKLRETITMIEMTGFTCDCVVNQTLQQFELRPLEMDKNAHTDTILDNSTSQVEILYVSVPMMNTCQGKYINGIVLALYALKTISNLTATLLQAAEVLAEVNLHMVSSSSAAGDFGSRLSKSTPGQHNTTSSSTKEEEEERDSQGVAPIDLAVAMESACWDLDFLVSLNARTDILCSAASALL